MWFSNIQATYFVLVECHSLSFSGVILFLLSHQVFMNVKLFIKPHVSRHLQDSQYFIPHPHLRQLWYCWDWASFCSLCYLEFMIHLSQDPHILRTVSMWCGPMSALTVSVLLWAVLNMALFHRTSFLLQWFPSLFLASLICVLRAHRFKLWVNFASFFFPCLFFFKDKVSHGQAGLELLIPPFIYQVLGIIGMCQHTWQ